MDFRKEEKTFRRLRDLLLLSATVLLLAGCGRGDLTSPDATVRTAQEALDNRNWKRLYKTVGKKMKRTQLPRWRKRLKSLLKRSQANPEVDAGNIDSLSRRQVFRTHMKALSNHRRWKQLLKQYASTDYTISRTDENTASVQVDSRFPLPYTEATLARTSRGWKFQEMNR